MNGLPNGYDYAQTVIPTKAYLAGPMSFIPQFNIPAFDEAAKTLRERGYDVFSPAELDDPVTRAAALASPDGTGVVNGETWGDFLARDVKLIVDGGIEIVFVLPGWEKSRGARLETFVARALADIAVCEMSGHVIHPHALARAWAGGLWKDVIASVKTRIQLAFAGMDL